MAPLYKKCRLLGIDVPQLSAQAKSSGKEKHRNKLLAECRKRKHQLSHTLKNVKWARVAAEAADETDPALAGLAGRVLEVRADCAPHASRRRRQGPNRLPAARFPPEAARAARRAR